MEDGGTTRQNLDATLNRYLQSWGLQEFHDEGAYYKWQRATLSLKDLELLQSLVEQRQGGANERADIQFYDLLATPSFLPILYSQRFDYFRQIGLLLSPRLSSAKHVLDFGCGVGILTCFFAQQYPEIQFIGIDRSTQSIEMAQDEANKRHLSNLKFRVSKNSDFLHGDLYDCILSTQALLQSERESGLPSRNWQTFERENDLSRQEELEYRAGLYSRLELLLNVLSPGGRFICFEKTWNLGRRIFLQRALSERKLFLVCDPVLCSYQELGEPRIDGPLYEVSRLRVPASHVWNEAPYHEEGESVFRCVGTRAERMGREFDSGKQEGSVCGQHATHGPWSFRCGVWEEALAWGFIETTSGFRGLLLAAEGERNLIFQLLERAKLLTDIEFEEFLQSGWGHLDDVTQNASCPGYENHASSAQGIYETLPHKTIQQEETFAEGQGREMHIEVGRTNTFCYLYWANTLDQRQLLLMDESGAEMLLQYYQESLEAARGSS